MRARCRRRCLRGKAGAIPLELGLHSSQEIVADRTELAVAGVVLVVLALLATVASPARATLWMEALMLGGAVLLAVAQLASSWLFSLGPGGGIVWSICSGSGIFLGKAQGDCWGSGLHSSKSSSNDRADRGCPDGRKVLR
eukprot:COSAG04_NODE_11663_length_695_cov_1.298658_3_plen_139_part_01